MITKLNRRSVIGILYWPLSSENLFFLFTIDFGIQVAKSLVKFPYGFTGENIQLLQVVDISWTVSWFELEIYMSMALVFLHNA